jgi:hypothetical protein
LRFDRTRPFSADELRRLSPSVPFENALICAHLDDGALRIWGVAHSGPAWLAPTWGGRNTTLIWTRDPIVHVTGAGQLAVRSAGNLLGALERGMLVDTTMDVFASEWLPQYFEREREDVLREHRSSTTSIEPTLVRLISQHMIRRAIQLIRATRHGGMLLTVDADVPTWSRTLRLKYTFDRGEPTQRYRALLRALLDRLASDATSESVGWLDFVAHVSPELEKNEQAIFEISRLIAGLASIDGAVVLSKRFDLIGFGAEVSAELPSPTEVWRAIDVEGNTRVAESIESVGTRHRAAYRFVRDHAAGLAVVVSNDGAVRFVANRGGEVYFWEQSVSP